MLLNANAHDRPLHKYARVAAGIYGACVILHPDPASAAKNTKGFMQHGIASVYAGAKGLTMAHKTLPFGTRVRVRASNGQSVCVRVADRGPFIPGRIGDLSYAAGRRIGLTENGKGIMRVSLRVVSACP
jgi:rare lipoprotein A (peptidoglycan hydrolase)